CARSSPIMRAESGQPTWLHSSRTCAHPQLHISSWPRRLKRDCPAPSITKVMTHSRASCTVRAQNTGPPESLALRNCSRLRMGHLRHIARRAQCRNGILLPHSRRRAHKIGNERNERPQHHNRHANPYPRDQRIQEYLDDGYAAVRVPSLETVYRSACAVECSATIVDACSWSVPAKYVLFSGASCVMYLPFLYTSSRA